MPVDLSHAALLEIDFQHWIIESFGASWVIDRAAAARSVLRSAGAHVICTRYLSLDRTDTLRADPDGRGAAFHPALTPSANDLLLSKHGRNIFDNPELEQILRSRGVTDVVITGIATDYGVALAARTGRSLGFRTSVVADACAATSPESHERTLAELSADGITVIRDLRSCVGVHSNA